MKKGDERKELRIESKTKLECVECEQLRTFRLFSTVNDKINWENCKIEDDADVQFISSTLLSDSSVGKVFKLVKSIRFRLKSKNGKRRSENRRWKWKFFYRSEKNYPLSEQPTILINYKWMRPISITLSNNKKVHRWRISNGMC